MNSEEKELVYEFDDFIPNIGKAFEICNGIKWIRMDLPFALNHINLWLINDNIINSKGKSQKGWTIVDCGIFDDKTQSAWKNIFSNELEGLPVHRVLATHCHPDHIGLAEWLCKTWNVKFFMTAGEYSYGRILSAGLEGANDNSMIPHFKKNGVTDDSIISKLLNRKNHFPKLVPKMPISFIRLEEEVEIKIGDNHWKIIIGKGHSPEHAALYCKNREILISGDMILPRISTNTSVFPIEPEADAVGNFLASIKKFLELPEQTLVLPSHGKPFRGLHKRVNQLVKHHSERLKEVKIACKNPKSAAEIVPIMFRRELDIHQLGFAMGEALAHLNRLWHEGDLKKIEDNDGIIRFVSV